MKNGNTREETYYNENMVEWNAEMLIQTFEEMREEIEMCIKEENVLTYLDM